MALQGHAAAQAEHPVQRLFSTISTIFGALCMTNVVIFIRLSNLLPTILGSPQFYGHKEERLSQLFGWTASRSILGRKNLLPLDRGVGFR
jgi:hypothetical protein